MIDVKSEEFDLFKDSEGRLIAIPRKKSDSVEKKVKYIIRSNLNTYVANTITGYKYTRDPGSAKRYISKSIADGIAENMTNSGDPNIKWVAVPVRS